MRWILCGKNDAAVEALELLVEKGDEVWAVGTRTDEGRDGWQSSFRGAAERLGVRFSQPSRINDPMLIGELAEWNARALVSIQYDQILRAPLFDAIGCPCLNLHFALLPRHRGVAPMAWAILAGDLEAGVTLHHMVVDVDAGDVLAQKTVAVGPADTARDLYDKVSAAAGALFRESYPFSNALLGARLPQDPALASYHRAGDLDFTQTEIDWAQPAHTLQRWLRALIFPPFQYPETSSASRRFRVQRVAGRVGVPQPAAPGTVLANGPAGLEIAALEGTIAVTEFGDPREPDALVENVMAAIPIGVRLGAQSAARAKESKRE